MMSRVSFRSWAAGGGVRRMPSPRLRGPEKLVVWDNMAKILRGPDTQWVLTANRSENSDVAPRGFYVGGIVLLFANRANGRVRGSQAGQPEVTDLAVKSG